jgi:beta-N-acetylhexosaminidase
MTKRVLWLLLSVLLLVPVQAQSAVDALLASMSLQQKVAQMFVLSFYGAAINEPVRDLLRAWQPGAVVLLPSNLQNPEQITRLTNAIQQALVESGGVPAWITVDQEGGLIAHLETGFTRWAVPMLLTATRDEQLAYQFGEALAAEMRAVGLNMNLAPVADLYSNRQNPIIGRRSFGEEPAMVAATISAVVRGMQDAGVLATVKHFPGHGDTDSDSHLELPQVLVDRETLFTRELVPFRAAMASDVGAVMVAHLYFPALGDAEALPASLSERVISGLLRGELGYDGLIITDALDMDAIDTVYSPEEAAIRAIEAGNDLILLGAHISPEAQIRSYEAVTQAVEAGSIPLERIEASVRRILLAKERFGVLGWQALDAERAAERIDLDGHARLLESMFTAGITVVRDASGLIPLPDGAAFIFPASEPGLWRECRTESWVPLGVAANPTADDIAAASQLASGASAVVIFTQNAAESAQQRALAAAMPAEKTLVVALWSPFDDEVLPAVSSYMVTYSPLSASYPAVCAILRGENVARGMLPFWR